MTINVSAVWFTPRRQPGDLVSLEMEAEVEAKAVGDLRDYLAEERTLLAWLRTGIGLMGFGFVTAHFELFADEPHVMQYASGFQRHGLSLWFGTALVLMGVVVNLLSVRRYMRIVGELNRGQSVPRSLPREAVVIGLLLTLLSIAMAIYLTPFAAQPPHLPACLLHRNADRAL